MELARIHVSPERTHHLLDGHALYDERYDEALSFHPPGLASVRRGDQAWHIDLSGRPVYAARFLRTFGFYEGRAAVVAPEGWHHILPDGTALGRARYAWCGNFQQGRSSVRDREARYFHIDLGGEPAYDARWRYAGDFREGAAVVQADGGLSTHIDEQGRELHARRFLDLDVFHKGFARARDRDGWTHVDRRGRPSYERRFSSVEPFYNGQARVERFDGGVEIIDEDGHTVLELRSARETPLQRLSSMMVGFWKTQIMRAAADLGVFARLPMEARDVEPAIARLLRALWELGLVARIGDRWDITALGASFRGEVGLTEAARLWGTEHYAAWTDLGAALASGRSSFEGRYGAPFFEWLAARPDELRRYHAALHAYAKHDYAPLASVLPLEGALRVIDAGGGTGALVELLLERHVALEATLFDRPEVLERVELSAAVRVRAKLVGGDLFSPWPCRGDLVVLARVLHDWDDERARQILVHARRALLEHGRICIIELVLSDDHPNGGMLDLNMLVMCGSRERTEAEWRSLVESADLCVDEITALPTYGSMITVRSSHVVAR